LASVVLSHARGRSDADSRLRVQLEQATTEIALLREELNIKDGRWERSRSRRGSQAPSHHRAVPRRLSEIGVLNSVADYTPFADGIRRIR
jgi:hypothetical protein